MKRICLCAVLLLCILVLSCVKETPLPDGIRMGMTQEKIAGLTGGILSGNSVLSDDGIYYFGENGLIGVIFHNTP